MSHFTVTRQSVKHLNRTGNILRARADEVDFGQMEPLMLKEVIHGLFYAMYVPFTGVGLAAPMVGLGLRIAVIDDRESPPFVLINPTVIDASDDVEEGREANLCLPEISALVKRPKKIRVHAYNQHGKEFEETYEGFLARIVLHELEIFDGRMFHDNADPDKIHAVSSDIRARKTLAKLYGELDNNGVGDKYSNMRYFSPVTLTPEMSWLQSSVLRKKAASVDLETWAPEELRELVDDMLWLMYENNGVGIAAPQLGLSIRMTTIDDREHPPYVLINPTITEFSEERESDTESCISILYRRAEVPRSTGIKIVAQDITGQHIELEAEGFFARVIQHEVDHLDGILYPDRLGSSSTDLRLTEPGVLTNKVTELLYPSIEGAI